MGPLRHRRRGATGRAGEGVSTRPIEPNGSAGGPLTPFLILGLAWSVICLMWLSWLAGRLAAAVTGRPPTGPGFGTSFLELLLRGDWAALWPGVSPAIVGVIYAVLVLLLVGAATAATMWWQT